MAPLHRDRAPTESPRSLDAHISADVSSAINRWASSRDLLDAIQAMSLPWLHSSDPAPLAMQYAARAVQIASNPTCAETGGEIAEFCLVTKQPHAGSILTTSAIIARLLAFGVHVLDIRELVGRHDIARVLYPDAHRYFTELPRDDGTWKMIADKFDKPSFKDIFGIPYSPSLVLTGSNIMATFGLEAKELIALWEEGRSPITHECLASRYGDHVAEMILAGNDSYTWFRGAWPLGIQRIAPGLVAFALRDERIDQGHPVIILNGHFPGLAQLFQDRTTVIRAGISAEGLRINDIRKWLVGNDNRPSACEVGSIRRDADDGRFPLDSKLPVDSRHNVVHCSDGLLTGMIESQRLFCGPGVGGDLVRRLQTHGLLNEEIQDIVSVDPLIPTPDGFRRLTSLTRNKDIDECAATILHFVPPVFGPQNGHASGLTLSTLSTQLRACLQPQPRVAKVPVEETRPLSRRPIHPSELPDNYELIGRRVLASGQVAMVVPAGGTGGRFGGYDLPETDLRRQKAMFPCFTAHGSSRSALDIRVANAAYWRAQTGGRVPVAVMGSGTNYELLRHWHSHLTATGLADLVTYRQFGAYRIHDPTITKTTKGTSWWVDDVIRDLDGAPSLKPPGNLGTLTCLVLAGILTSWADEGIEYLAIANGDDIAFRLDPRIVAFLECNPSVDAVVMAVPWGISGSIHTASGHREMRGDASGWCDVGAGMASVLHPARDVPEVSVGDAVLPILDASFDVGGRVCDVKTGTGWRTGVIEAASTDSLVDAGLLSTNQIYLRVPALRRLIGLADDGDLPALVADFVTGQPFRAEHKVVQLAHKEVKVLQLAQAISAMLQQISTVPMRISRSARPRQFGSYAPLKRQSDIAFAQSVLDGLAVMGDQLVFPS